MAYNPLFTKSISDESYDLTASWKDKIIFTLKKLGKAGTQDVIDYIQRQEPANTTVKNNVATVLSRLASNKEVKSKTDVGGKNIYFAE